MQGNKVKTKTFNILWTNQIYIKTIYTTKWPSDQKFKSNLLDAPLNTELDIGRYKFCILVVGYAVYSFICMIYQLEHLFTVL